MQHTRRISAAPGFAPMSDLQRVTLFLTPKQIAAIDRQRRGLEPRSVWIRRLVERELERSRRRLGNQEQEQQEAA